MNSFPFHVVNSCRKARSLFALSGLFFVLTAILTGCSQADRDHATSENKATLELFKLRLQTDWLPQPEHGGFYYAQAAGFYAEEGLAVEILPGGPNAVTVAKVLRGDVDVAMNRADAIFLHAADGMPFQFLFTTLQHDPAAILLHASNPISSLAELDGKTIMGVPGSPWIAYLEKRYDISLRILPHDFSLNRFLADETFIQQCMLTNEPFFARLNGADPKVLPMAESGFNPYHLVYSRTDFAARHPEVIERFMRASLRGWQAYVTEDPSEANALIAERNPQMSDEFMQFIRETMIERRLVTGFPERGEATGQISLDRLEELRAQMVELGLLPEEFDVRTVYPDR